MTVGGRDFLVKICTWSDFLFSLLSLPVGTFIKILEEDSSIAGCIGCLYDNSENLKITYVQLGDAFLHPAALSPVSSSFHSMSKTFYRCNQQCDYGTQDTCGGCRGYIIMTYATTCPSCKNQMTTQAQLTLVLSTESRGQATAVVSDKGIMAAYGSAPVANLLVLLWE
jgi:hypothetical protein